MKDRVMQVMSETLNIDKSLINEQSTPETLAQWDSLTYLTLVLALESEFDIKFSDPEIMAMDSVEKIISAIASKNPA